MIKSNDFENALRVWENVAGKVSIKSFSYKRNLAILNCFLLSINDNKSYLKNSLSIWKELVESDKFWTTFSKSYNLHDEQTASQTLLLDFKKHVVSYLADIYTELYQIHQNTDYINQFQKVFSTKGAKTENDILRPAYKAINEAVEGLEKMNISEDGVIDEKESRQLKKFIGIIQGELNNLIDLGLYNDSRTKIMRDKAAEAIRKISLDIHNNLNEREIALRLSNIALKISGMAGSRIKLEQDQEIIKQNIVEEKKNPMSQCWFCQNPLKNQNSSLGEKMHKVTKTEQSFSGTRTHYQMYELTIPRCTHCADFHRENDSKFMKIGIGIGIAGGIAISVLADFGFWGLLIISVIFVFIGIAVFDAVGKRRGTDTIKSENYKKQFPFYKEMIVNGWQSGEKPSS
ncbi:hypothetical protein KJ863_01355 [Patescibacteria group bacterium]|nr:hypothetical protein [Candidatus Falkowbacteria bacterium]MBU4014787.1 hypothetical protein [Patescibacteria group bacterium]MBU4072746.1 hypothetical protein [Patescibacteria group bacterium]MBU4124873.1 hypothetical protein [Patescibacteria group bacterium]